jgi:hypothetical protein
MYMLRLSRCVSVPNSIQETIYIKAEAFDGTNTVSPDSVDLSRHLPDQSCLPRLLLNLIALLLLLINLLLLFAVLFSLVLIRSPDSDILGLEITEGRLEPLLDDPACSIIDNHNGSNHNLKLGRKRHKLKLIVDLRDELCCAREGDTRNEDETPVHSLVLANRLTEGTALVVDCESGDLLDELQEVDRRVEERRLELFLEIDISLLGICALHVL